MDASHMWVNDRLR